MRKRGQIVAEFFLVVLGVLVALSVDTWIEQRKDNELRNEYLARLGSEIEFDIDAIRYRIEFFGEIREYGVQTLNWLHSDDPADDPQLLMAAYYAAEEWPFAPRDDTYVDMQNTGNARLLRDFDLRVNLAAYYGGTSRRRSGYLLPDEYRALVRGIMSPQLQEAIRTYCPTNGGGGDLYIPVPESCVPPNLSAADVSAVMEELRAHPDTVHLLSFRLSELDVSIDLFEVTLRSAEEARQAFLED